MSDEQFWRIVVGGLIMGLITGFAPQIMEFLRRIGYTGWK